VKRSAFLGGGIGAIAAIATAFLAAPLWAQANSTVFTVPWTPEPHWADTYDDIVFFNDTDTKDYHEATDFFFWDSRGRIKFLKDDPDPSFVLGYKIVNDDSRSDNRVIGGQLNDFALTGSTHVDGLIDAWRVHVMGGAGTANDGYFRNGDSWYPVAALGGSRRVGESALLHVGVEYDGSRCILPDVPLPYISYRDSLGTQFQYALGVPETSATYLPFEDASISLKYIFPERVDLVSEYEFVKHLRVFAQYTHVLEAMWMGEPNRARAEAEGHDFNEHDRLFHEFDRVGGGLRLVTTWLDASLGAGWAFSHRFMTGWDCTNMDTYRELEGGWYVALRMQGSF
jgi:hypothetical protein